MAETIHIFFTINDSYCKYLAVSMASILLNTNRKVNFCIIDGGISEDNKRKIEQLKEIKDFSIEYLTIDKSLFANMPSSSQAHISNETNYRFLISSIKKDLDKCIFLDADLVVNRDISQLWEIDLEDNYMAAVTDQVPLDVESWAKKLPLPADYVYVNTGVTLMNLRKWREDKIEEKFFANVIKNQNLLKFPDQDILNITTAPKVKHISHRFNAMPVQIYRDLNHKEEAFANPAIIHWAGNLKPWLYPEVPYAHIFWKYARMTPFYEEIIYNNFQEVQSQLIAKSVSNVNFSVISDAINYTANKLKYWRYKLLSKITFGKKRKKYKQKRKDLKARLKQVRKFLRRHA